MSANLCPTTGEMHSTDWTECSWCRYLCHCGEPIIIHEDGFTRGLCEECDCVRCDVEPSACRSHSHKQPSGPDPDGEWTECQCCGLKSKVDKSGDRIVLLFVDERPMARWQQFGGENDGV